MRTSQLFIADNNSSFTTVWHQKFETLKSIFQKKAPTNRSMLSSGAAGRSSSGATNAKHAGVLQDAGISYDTPLNPVQVAAMRAERIAQKQKAAAAMAEQAQLQQQQQQRLTTPAVVGVAAGSAPTPNSQNVAAGRVATVASPSVNTIGVAPVVAGSASGVTQHTMLLQGAAQVK
jgi:E1A-binding protein p400